VDGDKKGITPLTLSDFLVGKYNLKISKQGYGTVTKTLTIQEGETISVDAQLPQAKKVAITSQPSGADLYIDGSYIGKTPYEGELGFGRRKVKMINGERTKQRSIHVTDGGKDIWRFEVFANKGTFIDSRDGQTYEWVRIGDQVWMAENLNYDQDAYGDDKCYNNDPSNSDTYGRLYNWDAVMQGESSSHRNYKTPHMLIGG